MVATALTGCAIQEPPDARRQTAETSTGVGGTGDSGPSPRETPDARRQTPGEATTAPPTEAPITSPPPSTTTLPVRTIEVIERAGWGAAEAGPGMVEHAIERLTIHHTGVELGENRLAPARLKAHQEFHQGERGWPDLAYHFAVDPGGNIYEGRSPQFRGDTATSYDPTGHFLVVLEGNFDIEATAGPQIVSLTELLAWAARYYSVGTDTIKSHRDFAETTCPGQNLYALLRSGELVAAVNSILDREDIDLAYLRGTEALDRVTHIESP